MEDVVESGFFGRWDAMPVRYRYMMFALVLFIAGLAAGTTDSRWATPAWALATMGGAFICIYAFPSVWRYVFYLGLVYILIALGTVPVVMYVDAAPFFIGWAFVLHALALLVAFNLLKDVWMTRKAYHITAIGEGKEAPYVPIGLWTVALAGFMVMATLSMITFGMWALDTASLAPYAFCELTLIVLLMYLLEIPERAYGGKGADFVPKVSIAGLASGTKKVAKKLVKRTKPAKKPSKTAAIAAASLRPKQLAGGALECPVCGSELAIDERRCPDCYRENEFAWCPVSEHYIIPCPACGKPTVYGEEKCSHCGHGLTLDYKCPNCLKASPLQRWERA